MLRTSNYLVLIPLSGGAERFLAHHGMQGGYDLVSRAEAEFLLAGREGRRPRFGEWVSGWRPPGGGLAEAPGQPRLEFLVQRGYLTSRSAADEEALFMRALGRVHQRCLAAVMGYSFVVSVTGGTAEHPSSHPATDAGSPPLPHTLSTELIDTVCASMPAFERAREVEFGAQVPRRIGIVGEHSFRSRHRAVLEHLVQRTQAIGPARIWAETQGAELEELSALVGRGRIETISFKFDGDPGGAGGGASPVRALGAKIDAILGAGAEVMLKVTVTPVTLQLLPELAALAAANGWEQEPRFQAKTVLPEPGTPERRELEMRLAELGERCPAVQRWAGSAAVPGRPPAPRPAAAFDVVSQLVSDHHLHTYVFGPDGGIYPSTPDAGDARLRVGEVSREGGIRLFGEAFPPPRSATAGIAPECRGCRYGVHCGWGREVDGGPGTAADEANGCDRFGTRCRSALEAEYLGSVAAAAAARSATA